MPRLVFLGIIFPVILAFAAQDKPPDPTPPPPTPPPVVTAPVPAPAPLPSPPAPPPPDPGPAPTDVPPVHGGRFGRDIYEITMVDLPARGALTKVKSYGLAGWQLCQVEQFTEMVQDDTGLWRQENKVRFWLQRRIVPTEQAQ